MSELIKALREMAPTQRDLRESSDQEVFEVEGVFFQMLMEQEEQIKKLSEAEREEYHNIIEAVVDEADVRRARNDPNAFIEYVMTDDVSGEPFEQAPFHREIQDLIGTRSRLLLLAPRGHGKSSQVVGRILWELGRNPNVRIKIISNTDPKAAERVTEVQNHIETNKRLKRVFPDLKPAKKGEWTKSKCMIQRTRVLRDASLEGYGVLSSGVGGRADIMILDDVQDQKNAIQEPGKREKVISTVKSAWIPQIAVNGWCVAIATLWHKKDLHHNIGGDALKVFLKGKTPDQSQIEEGDWYVQFYAVGDNFEPVWGEVWGVRELKAMYRSIGRVAFNRGYRNRATDDGTKIIELDWIEYFEPKDMPHRSEMITIQSYDLAVSTRVSDRNSYFACVTLCADVRATPIKIYVLDFYHARLSFPEQVAVIQSGYNNIKPDIILIEAVAYQQALPQHLKATTLLPVVPIRAAVSKSIRLEGVSPLVESGNVVFSPRLNGEINPRVMERGDLIDELTEFPIGESDDGVDAFSQGVNYVQEYQAALLNFGGIEDVEGDVFVLGGDDSQVQLEA